MYKRSDNCSTAVRANCRILVASSLVIIKIPCTPLCLRGAFFVAVETRKPICTRVGALARPSGRANARCYTIDVAILNFLGISTRRTRSLHGEKCDYSDRLLKQGVNESASESKRTRVFDLSESSVIMGH